MWGTWVNFICFKFTVQWKTWLSRFRKWLSFLGLSVGVHWYCTSTRTATTTQPVLIACSDEQIVCVCISQCQYVYWQVLGSVCANAAIGNVNVAEQQRQITDTSFSSGVFPWIRENKYQPITTGKSKYCSRAGPRLYGDLGRIWLNGPSSCLQHHHHYVFVGKITSNTKIKFIEWEVNLPTT